MLLHTVWNSSDNFLKLLMIGFFAFVLFLSGKILRCFINPQKMGFTLIVRYSSWISKVLAVFNSDVKLLRTILQHSPFALDNSHAANDNLWRKPSILNVENSNFQEILSDTFAHCWKWSSELVLSFLWTKAWVLHVTLINQRCQGVRSWLEMPPYLKMLKRYVRKKNLKALPQVQFWVDCVVFAFYYIVELKCGSNSSL